MKSLNLHNVIRSNRTIKKCKVLNPGQKCHFIFKFLGLELDETNFRNKFCIRHVTKNSVSDNGGLKAGDIILKVNGKQTYNMDYLAFCNEVTDSRENDIEMNAINLVIARKKIKKELKNRLKKKHPIIFFDASKCESIPIKNKNVDFQSGNNYIYADVKNLFHKTKFKSMILKLKGKNLFISVASNIKYIYNEIRIYLILLDDI